MFMYTIGYSNTVCKRACAESVTRRLPININLTVHRSYNNVLEVAVTQVPHTCTR